MLYPTPKLLLWAQLLLHTLSWEPNYPVRCELIVVIIPYNFFFSFPCIFVMCGITCSNTQVKYKGKSDSLRVFFCSIMSLCDHRDYSLTGSSVRGIFQARILDQVTIFCSRGSSPPRDQARISGLICTCRQILYHCVTWETH